MTLGHGLSQQAASPILCAVDQSMPSDTALRVAVSLAGVLHRPLHLVHVWSGAIATAAEGQARRFLSDAAADADAESYHFEINGSADGIANVAERISADLVVIGTHSRGRLGRFLLGSTAGQVLHRARWPLLVVRAETSWPPRQIVIGEDSSEAAAYAGGMAAAISAAYGAAVTLVEAVPELIMPIASADPTGRKVAKVFNKTKAHVDNRAAAIGAAGGHSPHGTVSLVAPDRALMDTIRSCTPALLVVGHRSTIEMRDGNHRSVAESLIRTAHAPILIYPEAAVDKSVATRKHLAPV